MNKHSSHPVVKNVRTGRRVNMASIPCTILTLDCGHVVYDLPLIKDLNICKKTWCVAISTIRSAHLARQQCTSHFPFPHICSSRLGPIKNILKMYSTVVIVCDNKSQTALVRVLSQIERSAVNNISNSIFNFIPMSMCRIYNCVNCVKENICAIT